LESKSSFALFIIYTYTKDIMAFKMEDEEEIGVRMAMAMGCRTELEHTQVGEGEHRDVAPEANIWALYSCARDQLVRT
jgi:hypothetical protein